MKFHAITDVGRMRSQNQDNVYGTTSPIGPLPNLFLVADGMGGHNAGDYASRRAIELVKESVEQSPGTEPVEVLRTAITTANDMLFSEARQQEEKSGMGTTFVAATIVNEELLVANVGDSRLYVLHDGQLRQITLDHSLVEEMARTALRLLRERVALPGREPERTVPLKVVVPSSLTVRSSTGPVPAE